MIIYPNISFLIVTLVLGFNSTMAFESAENAKSFYAQENSPPVKKKKEPRRRGDCTYLPSVWTANICETKTFCYQTPEEVRLWLPKHKRSGQMNDRLVIQNQNTQTAVIKSWAASKVTFKWPLSNIPLQSGTTYSIGLKRGCDYSFINLTLYQIPASLSKRDQIATMRQHGCSQQADMLEKMAP